MIDNSNCILIGTLTKSHGINGEVAILLNDGFYSDQINASYLFLDLDGGLVPFKTKTIRDKSESVILVKFELCKNEKDIVPLIGSSVWVDRKDAVQTDADTGTDSLIGFSAYDKKHGNIGVIIELRDMDRNPLFVVNGKKGEILIPIADEFILDINDKKKEIHLVTPEGLLDLYL